MMREIPLTRGFMALVDDEDFDELSKHKWHIDANGYAVRTQHTAPRPNRKTIALRMHRVLMGLDNADGRRVDHKDGNRLNNQRANLRICTGEENTRNQRIRKDNRTGFKGVVKATGGFWRAQIHVNKKRFDLGLFESPEEAHGAYCKAALEKHGEFANFGRKDWMKDGKSLGRFGKLNKTGFSGVSQRKEGVWRAKMVRDGKNVSLGEFLSPEVAHLAYRIGVAEFHEDPDPRTTTALKRALDFINKASRQGVSR